MLPVTIYRRLEYELSFFFFFASWLLSPFAPPPAAAAVFLPLSSPLLGVASSAESVSVPLQHVRRFVSFGLFGLLSHYSCSVIVPELMIATVLLALLSGLTRGVVVLSYPVRWHLLAFP